MTSDLRLRQRALLDHSLTRLRGRASTLPDLPLDELRRAGLATGLTALVAALHAEEASPTDGPSPEVADWLAEQRGQVAARVARMRDLAAVARGVLARAGVPAVVVKGGALIDHVWGLPDARPMADVDVVVPPWRRAETSALLGAAGFRWASSGPTEDTWLAWGDGTPGRLDGESVDHNGKLEIHPGWCEALHGYTVAGPDLLAAAVADPSLPGGRRLPLAVLTAHVLGHLASTVVRSEVRAVNVVDVWWCDAAGVDWDEVAAVLARTDPRLTGPGLWLAHALLPDRVPVRSTSRELDRLPLAARRCLDAAAPEDVFRDPFARTTVGWRQAFASGTERAAVLDQMAFPDGRRAVGSVVARVASRVRPA